MDTREGGLSPMKQRLEVGVDGASGTQAVQSSDSSAVDLLVGRAAACSVSSLHSEPSFGQESFMQSTTESNNMQKVAFLFPGSFRSMLRADCRSS